MSEPKYDEDLVNLGYLKKIISNEAFDSGTITISRHYASKPTPPYYAGDTWIDGNTFYTCVNTRLIGLYVDSDWTTESGAKEEAEKKNKTYLSQPSNYNIGDMWILQADTDHKAGKKGEILITIVSRKEYDESDWVNILGYGTIASINEVANNLNNAVNRIGNVEEAIEDGIIITFYQSSIPNAKHIGDLWYVTETVDKYTKGKLYRYNGTEWQLLDDPEIQKAFERANEARLVADGKIQSFYSETEPTENMGVGDLWIDTLNNNKLYRYNGTNWIPVYDTRVDIIENNVETISKRTVDISTDLGEVKQTVTETTTVLTNLQQNIEEVTNSLDNNIDILSSEMQKKLEDLGKALTDYQVSVSTQFEQTNTDFNFLFNQIIESIANNEEGTNEKFAEITKYIRFEDGNIILGRSDNELILKIQNDRISYQQNGSEVAYFSNNQLYVTKIEVTESLKIGNFAFIPRANGNTSFKKVGVN
ncbi:MAG: hypothetical protein ACI4UU_00520 [Clostridia bacterium]